MPTFVRVYSGDDGQSHIEEFEPDFKPFVDTEGAHGEGTPLEAADSSGPNAGVLAGVAAIAAGIVTLSGAAWYTRRRWG